PERPRVIPEHRPARSKTVVSKRGRERHRQAAEMRARGLTLREIGERLGVSTAVAWGLVSQGVPPGARGRRGWPPKLDRRRAVAELRAQGLTLRAIGERLDTSHQAVSNLLKPPASERRGVVAVGDAGAATPTRAALAVSAAAGSASSPGG